MSRARAALSASRACHVARDEVDLQVHRGARGERAQVRLAPRDGDDHDVERRRRPTALTVRLTPLTAIEPFSATKRASVGRERERQRERFAHSAARASVPTPSTCPLTRWPPRRSPARRARSRLTRRPTGEPPERRPRERLGRGVDREAVGQRLGDREARPVDRDRLAEGQRLRRRAAPRMTSRAPGPRAVALGERPLAPTRPVNMGVAM